ncbi:AMP-dependent synthetase/ligase [Penicillium mononematosum]|uniref:AMP-dependent synthetase/ligase n=1 Tax=Penicillium mononematosum TaxID=268346 RepID=UPI00254818D0|nr:AMP-dependent synthetase/ligase [Penicillium mononematosum]KAJ6191416.1 AMP-dependent synthetase/ligase [Penicillium mononematosum]
MSLQSLMCCSMLGLHAADIETGIELQDAEPARPPGARPRGRRPLARPAGTSNAAAAPAAQT